MANIIFINIFQRSGGGEIYLERLISELKKNSNREDSLLLISPQCNVLNHFLSSERTIKGCKGKSWLLDILTLFISICQINIKLYRLKPSLVIINGDRAIFLAPFLFFSRKKIGIKHMLIDSKFKAIMNKIAFRSLDKIVTISKFHIKNYSQWNVVSKKNNKVILIYNSVDTDVFKNNNKKYNDKTVFLEIASLEKRKGQFDLLTAFKEITKKNLSAELYLAGEGNDLSKINDYIKNNDLSNSVFLLGFQKDIPSLINKADVIVLPSYNEGLPISILEALSCERPVISTNIAGIPEVLSNRNCGIIINPGDIEALFNSMCKFINNKELIYEMGQNGRKTVLEHFSKEIWIKKWINVLELYHFQQKV